MYCSLATTVTFGFLSLLLFRLTFEGCDRSLSTLLSWTLFNYFSRLYNERTFGLFLNFFNFFGKFFSHLMLTKGLPLGFYKHCYPVFKRYEPFSKSCVLCSLKRLNLLYFVLVTKKIFVTLMYSFSNLLGKLLNRHLGRNLSWFNLYGFFGVFLSVRLFFLLCFLFSLLVVVKYFSKLLNFKSFNKLLLMALVPCVFLASLTSFFVYKCFFSALYLVGSLVLTGVMYYANFRHLNM